MEVELKNIIDKIKKDGVETADKEAAAIIEKAKSQAENMIAEAEKKGKEIKNNAAAEAEKTKKAGEEALKQASRDVILGLKDSIVGLFDRIVKRDVAGVLTNEVIKEMVLKVAEKMEIEKDAGIEILLGEENKKDLEKYLLDSLSDTMKKGVTVKVSPNIAHGFRIGMKGANSYYDFSDEAITEAFIEYLNPRISEILDTNK